MLLAETRRPLWVAYAGNYNLKPNLPEQGMTSLSPVDAERLKLAFQCCREMEGTLNEQLKAYAAAGREIFPAYGEAVDRLVIRVNDNGGGGKRTHTGRT